MGISHFQTDPNHSQMVFFTTGEGRESPGAESGRALRRSVPGMFISRDLGW